VQPKKEKKRPSTRGEHLLDLTLHLFSTAIATIIISAFILTPKLPWCPPGGGGSAAQKNGAAAGPGKRWLGVGSRVGDGGARAVALALFAPLAVPFLILLG
jgi:hypothetical protein